MIARHPWTWLPESRQAAVLGWSLVLTLLLIVVLQTSGRWLRTEAAPAGIVSFELAGSLSATNAILADWEAEQRTAAGFNLGIDYLFLFAYSICISLACALTSQRYGSDSWPCIAGTLLSWGALLAAALDAVENVALTRLLFGSQAPFLPPLARHAALLKFGLVFAGLAYVLLAAAFRARRR
jgi:hypothetical protein